MIRWNLVIVVFLIATFNHNVGWQSVVLAIEAANSQEADPALEQASAGSSMCTCMGRGQQRTAGTASIPIL